MKEKFVTKAISLGLTAVLAASVLSGCTFGFASDPDDPNERKEKEPTDVSVDTFQYDASLAGTQIRF